MFISRVLVPVFVIGATLSAYAREHPIIIEKPAGGELYVPGQSQKVELNPRTKAKSVLLELSRDGGVTFEVLGIIDNTVKDRRKRNVLSWIVIIPETGNGVIRATSTDERRPGNGLSSAFTIHTISPSPSSDPQYVLRAGDTMIGPLTLSENPTVGLHASTKNYVDGANTTQDTTQANINAAQNTTTAKKVYKAGDAMTGLLTLSGAPTANRHAATKQYVDDGNATQDTTIAGKVSKTGDTMTGALSVAGIVESSSGGIKFPDGTIQTTALVGGAVPPGFMILAPSTTPPSGFSYTGDYFTCENSNVWADKTSMPTARYAGTGCVVNGKIYVIGGISGSGPHSTNEEYDPGNDTWTTKAPMPTPRYGFAAAVVDNKIHIIGGYNTSLQTVHEVYDPATNIWTTKAAMPTERSEPGAGVVGGKIYVIGGRNGGAQLATALATNEVYDPATNQWATKADMPTARSGLSAVGVGGKVYAIGGAGGGSPAVNPYYDKNEQYDPTTNTWVVRSSMSAPRYEGEIAVVNGHIFIVGGFYPPDILKTFQEYNPSTNTWVDRVSMKYFRASPAVGAVNGRIYVIGGDQNSRQNEEFRDIYRYYIHTKD